MKRYFDHLHTITEVKQEYHRLTKIHHPDVGGSTETMQAINAQYTERVKHLKRYGERRTAEQARETTRPHDNAGKTYDTARHSEAPDEFIRIISAVVGLAGIDIDLVGTWVWITGNTYIHREALKAAGFRYASKKRAWYWHSPDDGCSRGGKKSLDEIKAKYGSERLTVDHVQRRAALSA